MSEPLEAVAVGFDFEAVQETVDHGDISPDTAAAQAELLEDHRGGIHLCFGAQR